MNRDTAHLYVPHVLALAAGVTIQANRGSDGSRLLGPLRKSVDCAVQSVSPLEGALVEGVATIVLEATPEIGMHFALRHAEAKKAAGDA